MRKLSVYFLGVSWILMSLIAHANDPISWQLTSPSIPGSDAVLGTTYTNTYMLTSNLPFDMPAPVQVVLTNATSEFSLSSDLCSNTKLPKNTSCTFNVNILPSSLGIKSATVFINYANSQIKIPVLTTTSTAAGIIGVDYNPNHYAPGHPFNDHDVFYAGSAGGVGVSNTYVEMSQLKAAGFNVIRSYQTVEYAWIDIINQASALGLKVVYEAAIPQNGSNSDITSAVSVLQNVITAVGINKFNSTVILVFAGHENYSNTDITYLVNAVNTLKNTLTANHSTVPVSSALVSGDLVTPGSVADMQALINSYSATAPLAFDPYPFQWGVTPPDQAASNISLTNSIAWDYSNVMQQSFYHSPRTILMAETGWATTGTQGPPPSGYYCDTQSNCQPGISNAATYLQAVYTYVRNSNNKSGVLVFEAYDEPAKDATTASDYENHYGVFDQDCNLKGPNNLNLLPNTSYVPGSNLGCQGFSAGAFFAVVGTQPGGITNQPPFYCDSFIT